MRTSRVAVIGAGVGGLVAALELAAQGIEVIVLERAPTPGGKLRELAVGNARIDSGPTVFTMRWVFEEIFDAIGETLPAHLDLQPVDVLARHAWDGHARLDLHADIDRSAEAIGTFAGAAEARGYRDFCARAQRTYATLEHSFIRVQRPTLPQLTAAAGIRGIGDLWRLSPYTTLWKALSDHFRDPRLRQLFGRYSTYSGSSPFQAPATLMLIAHVEQEGVWLVQGGMQRIVTTLADLATARGATVRTGAEVTEVLVAGGRACGVRLAGGERIEADAVIANADAAAIAAGLLGRGAAAAAPGADRAERSFSAVTWSMVAETAGFPLMRHNVFFSSDYTREFDDLRRARLPAGPTVYVCAQDRDAAGGALRGPERLLCLVNAPAVGDTRPFTASEIALCEERTFTHLRRCGLTVHRRPEATVVTTPAGFERLFPRTGGALYGRAVHGSTTSFQRPAARSQVPGLYLTGGSVHPGPGVPMAAMSGRLAVASLLADLASMQRLHRVAMPGGMSMRSAMTGGTGSR
ncbi:Hydroxyneurosporene desaturase [Rhodovastum atsumiense]|uniref:1-hydroxycarotenoid 3,4-desaturase CrtD n=1 Tax=Rhodovastum atsumiense TaxID=504468 RepID=UPI00193C2B36|nr:1-hydroxycarotenoid 3,4-desaturase CrtD [Rhodovastum atsumiense]CAH2601036.1 Hydroxyneurosporene desaturase [Rhodovastum atsumiense]